LQLLQLIFFISGAAALIFETLWFRQAGLTFGNSVWASSMVLASFMAGLALGNALSRRASSLRRPLVLYARIEIVIAAAGGALVLLFPYLDALLAPLFRLFPDVLTLNLVRLTVSFLLMLLPATAMGATLPLVVAALSRTDGNFGRVLGRLYGINTLGAVAGAIAAELFLIEWLGIRGTGLIAVTLDLIAARAAWLLAKQIGDEGAASALPAECPAIRPRRSAFLLLAAFGAGATLLALEVVWFRFLLLWVIGTSLAFALMLAVVLLGIAAGGILSAFFFTRYPQAHRGGLTMLPAVAALLVVLSYLGFDPRTHGVYHGPSTEPMRTFLYALRLMFPVSLVSGAMFTFIGKSLDELWPGDGARAASALTLSNTVGAMLGALLAGFVLLPMIGMERSFLLLAIAYGVIALLCAFAVSPGLKPSVGATALLILAFILFPFGLMGDEFIPRVTESYRRDGARLVAYREGRTETAMYLEKDLWGEPEYFRLMTNSHGMSASTFPARRYMSLFADWPAVVRPDARSALLISYGVGVTASALTTNPRYQSIDVVDISRDILDLNRRVPVHRGAHPLDDPRVRVHIEDGRFFLRTTAQRFDVITAEPPPPKSAGVVNLYSREYFQLMRSRLTRGGVATYWLPVYQMHPDEAKAIVNAFCDAFEDCTLWSGSGLEWMLAGTNGGVPMQPDLDRLWRSPESAARLGAIGFDQPELLASTFVADAAALRVFALDVAPVTDDFPLRLNWRAPEGVHEEYLDFMTADYAATALQSSRFVASVWPPAVRKRVLEMMPLQKIVNDALMPNYGAAPVAPYAALEYALSRTASRAVPLLLLDCDARSVEIASDAAHRGMTDAEVDYVLGARALSERDYAGAEARLAAASGRRDDWRYARTRIFARVMAGEVERAEELASVARRRSDAREPAFWKWYDAAKQRRSKPLDRTQ
jgi:predicted membrane-bound spermidine synthase